ncbi:hypothetical protein RCS94_06555 [Orbaceae bacterium ac157xtp]
MQTDNAKITVKLDTSLLEEKVKKLFELDVFTSLKTIPNGFADKVGGVLVDSGLYIFIADSNSTVNADGIVEIVQRLDLRFSPELVTTTVRAIKRNFGIH